MLPGTQVPGAPPYAPGAAAYGAADIRQRPPPPMAYAAGGAAQLPPGAVPLRAASPRAAYMPAAQASAACAGTPLLQPRPPYPGNAPPQPRRGFAPSQRVPAMLPRRGQQAGAPNPVFPEEEEVAPQPLAKAVPLNKSMFLAMGLTLLTMLCFLPIWDAIEMLHNLNYAFWGQRGLPVTVIIVSCLVIVFFFFTTEAFFGRWKNELQTTQSLVVMASLFITCLGLVLVLVSLPLSQKAIQTHNDIVYQCANSQATRMLRLNYMSLLNLRLQPACLEKYSIEECKGYREEKPYTSYLKAMEGKFRCSGFCYTPTKATELAINATTAGLSMLQANVTSAVPKQKVQSHRSNATENGQRRMAAIFAQSPGSRGTVQYPPTLFSQANFEASCDGAAARNLINFTRDTGYQMWYMGIALIALSISMGLWEWSAYVVK